MADVLSKPPPFSDAEIALLRDSEEALKRSRELLAQIEALLAFRYPRQMAQPTQNGFLSSALSANELLQEATIKQP